VLEAELKAPRGSFKLSDYSGKVLVLNLWATWVGPSQLETPELVKLYKQYRSQGVEMVGLSTENPNESTRQVRKWIRQFRVNYRIGWATPEVAITLMQGRDVVPQTFVVARSGRIVKRFVGFNPTRTTQQFKLAIEEALNETEPEQKPVALDKSGPQGLIFTPIRQRKEPQWRKH
jgi:thiol-disulfide isomerase/thioredoxin